MKNGIQIPIIRIISVILLISTAIMIFCFSSQNRKSSAKTSRGVTRKVCETVYPHFKEKTEKEKRQIVKRVHIPVRKIAHASEFFAFGAFAFLSVVTYKKYKLLIKAAASFMLSVLYAVSDEIHQFFVGGRGPQVKDVLIDSFGAAAAICILLLVFRIKAVKKFFGLEER